MLLAVDIGNSNIVLGGYHGDQLLFVARIRTDSLRTEFEYAVLIKDILSLYHCQPDDITGGIVSSVVPPLSSVLRNAIRLIKKVKVLTIGPGIKTGLNIRDNSVPICLPPLSAQWKNILCPLLLSTLVQQLKSPW